MSPLLLWCLFASPADLQRDFTAANDRALEGNHEAAIALYRSVLERGGDSADVYYNLGNTYAEAGRLVEAVVAWEQALRRDPGDLDTLANLETVRARLAPKTAQADAPPVTLAEVLEPFLSPFTAQGAALVILVASAALVLLLLARRRLEAPGLRRLSLFGLIAALLATAAGGGGLLAQAIVAREPRAVLVQPSELREGPNAKFKARGPAWAGARALVLEVDGEWWQVRLQDGTSGWIEARSALQLNPPNVGG